MKARGDGPQPQGVAAISGGGVQHRFEPFRVGAPHSAQVPFVVTIRNEVREDQLVEVMRLAIRGTTSGPHRLDHRRRDDDEPETQGREERLRERPDVENTPTTVEPLQTRDRTGAVAELGIVVILEDPRTGASGPVQQRETTSERHQDAEWELMRWCDVDELRIRYPPRRRLDVQSLVVHQRRMNDSACIEQCAAGGRIAWLLEQRHVTGIEQKP